MVYKNIRNFLILICIIVWLAVFSIDDNLHVIACDVGQGDAILIQKQNTQILIDGGPNQKVLDCLGKFMPFWDRKLELVILTHSEEDHYGGLIDVFKNYKIDVFANNRHDSSNQSYQVLKNVAGSRGVERLILHEGIDLRVGLIYLDILNPQHQKIGVGGNDQGVVVLLEYGQFKALFMADVENAVSDYLSANSEIQNVNYLKVNHHGSKNGLSQKLLDVTKPEVAMISVGKNSYGHPHQEVIKILSEKGIKTLRTDEMGNINYEVKN